MARGRADGPRLILLLVGVWWSEGAKVGEAARDTPLTAPTPSQSARLQGAHHHDGPGHDPMEALKWTTHAIIQWLRGKYRLLT